MLYRLSQSGTPKLGSWMPIWPAWNSPAVGLDKWNSKTFCYARLVALQFLLTTEGILTATSQGHHVHLGTVTQGLNRSGGFSRPQESKCSSWRQHHRGQPSRLLSRDVRNAFQSAFSEVLLSLRSVFPSFFSKPITPPKWMLAGF